MQENGSIGGLGQCFKYKNVPEIIVIFLLVFLNVTELMEYLQLEEERAQVPLLILFKT